MAGSTTLRTRQGPVRADGEAQTIRPRRSLPGGRAVAGAFLVATAAVGTFAAYTTATASDGETYLVARRDLTIGQTLSRDDLATATIEVPAFLQARAFRAPEALVGATLLGPVARGELIQASSIRRAGAGDVPGGREISFPVDASRAVDGSLQRGEHVDVLVTYGTGADAYTLLVTRAARLIDLRAPGGGLSDSRTRIVTLGVDTAEQALALANASSAGAVTLVRTGAPGGTIAAGEADRYQAPGPPAAPSDTAPRG